MKILKNKKILDICEADSKNAEEILAVLKQIGSETEFLVIDANGISLSLEQEKVYLDKNKKSINNKTFIGKVDRKIVTTCGLQGSASNRVDHNVSIGLSVLKDYWNIGIAQHMMNYLINYCKLTGVIKNLTLQVRSDNEAAIHIYDKLGFNKIGKYSNKVKIDNKFYDMDIMELQL